MKISVFNTDEYKKYKFSVRFINSIVFAGLILPTVLYCNDVMIFNSFSEFLLVFILGIMLFSLPCVGLTLAINEGKGYYIIKFIGSVICAPTLIIIEPIMKFIYYIFKHKPYKRHILYKMINDLPNY